MANLDLLRSDKIPDFTPAACLPPLPPSDPAAWPLAGRYRLEAPLGHGTASVFRARDLKTGLRYAIKRLPRDAALESGEHQRFVNEITLLSQLFHPNIVTMTALHRDDAGRSCLVMELLEGEDLLTHLAGGQRLPLPRVLAITRQVTSALQAAHLCGIAHRGFKLSSIFLAMQRGLCGQQVEVVKVVGFGGVKMRALSGQVPRHGVLGAVEYLPPEGLVGRPAELDESSDQWSVAVTVYRMLSGQLPFRADDEVALQSQIRSAPPAPLRDLCSELPQHVVDALSRALSKDKAQRFRSMAEFMRALSAADRTCAASAAPERACSGPADHDPQSAAGRPAETAGAPPISTGAAGGASLPGAVPGAQEPALDATAGHWATLASPRPESPSDTLLAAPGVPSGAGPVPASRPYVPGPISVSDVPTIATKLGREALDQTLNMEPAVLAQLCAQSQVSERHPLPSSPPERAPAAPAAAGALAGVGPPLPGSWLMQQQRRAMQRRQKLVLVLGSCLGLSLGMGAAWLLGPRAAGQLPTQPQPAPSPRAPSQQPTIAAAAQPPRSGEPRLPQQGLGMGTYRVCVQTGNPVDMPWSTAGSCRAWKP